MKTIGQRISAVRKSLGITQAELARKVGINQASISELESGKSQRTVHLAKIAGVLNVSPIWLDEGLGEMLPNEKSTVILDVQHIPKNVRELAEKLLLLPEDKLKAVSVLLGIKL